MSGFFLFIFALFWSTIVLFIDVAMVGESYKQFAAGNYPHVDGTMTRSEFTHRSSKSADIAIAYRFEVNGKTYEGDKLRLGTRVSGDPEETDAVNAHPVGSAVQVFYNPANPQESLLSPGLRGSDFFFTLFLAPFNMVMLGLWVGIGGWLRDRFFHPAAGGVKILPDGMVTRIRLPQLSALGWGIATAGGLGFISVFIVGFATRMQPPLAAILPAAGLVYFGGIAVYFWQRQKINSGIDDLILNEPSRTLELPLTFGRKERLNVRFSDIQSLAVEKVAHHSDKGTSYTYAPTLYLQDAAAQKLADWSDERKANEFADWLRPQLGPDVGATAEAPETGNDFLNRMAPPPVSTDEVRPNEGSRIRVTDGPNGKEFYFPAARNVGTAVFVTLFLAMWCGFLWLMIYKKAPLLFPIVFGLFALVLLWGCFNAWFRSTRLTIDSTAVSLTTRYLFFGKTRRFLPADIDRFERRAGMTSGNKVYSDIKLVPAGAGTFAENKLKYQQTGQMPPVRFVIRNLSGVTVGSSIANAGEAEWLVEAMNEALGRA